MVVQLKDRSSLKLADLVDPCATGMLLLT